MKTDTIHANYDLNDAIPDARAGRTSAVDAGLRVHMLRVYNYIAIGVGLTGVVAMLTYHFTGPSCCIARWYGCSCWRRLHWCFL
jgi:FtsH-binding integral membrane protein